MVVDTHYAPITAPGFLLAALQHVKLMSGCQPADDASRPPVGGIVPGDELMAVNGKVLLDAALSEGQNALTRAWNSGGVRRFK